MTSRYYAGDATLTKGDVIPLPSEESHHLLKTMRGRVGDHLVIFGKGKQHQAELVSVEGRVAVVKLGEALATGPPPPSVSMAFAIPWIKGGKTELVIQKLTELGASEIVVFQARREVARGDDSKRERLERITLEACKQCERLDVPVISMASSLATALRQVKNVPEECRFILHERNGELLSRVYKTLPAVPPRVLFASGPEGGWHEEELEEVGGEARYVSLGTRILRAETAPLAAAAALLTLAGDI